MRTGFLTNLPDSERAMYSDSLNTRTESMTGEKDCAKAFVGIAARIAEALAARMQVNIAEELVVDPPQPTAFVTLYHIAALVVVLSSGTT